MRRSGIYAPGKATFTLLAREAECGSVLIPSRAEVADLLRAHLDIQKQRAIAGPGRLRVR